MSNAQVRLTMAAIVVAAFATPAGAQDPVRDSIVDSLPAVRLPTLTVTVARRVSTLGRIPFAVSRIDGTELRRGRATDGLDEVLVTQPGLAIANRYNPSQDQRLSIRGFGARSAFGVRGVKVLLDGIPQTLPDGQGQLSNVELGDIASIETLRGSSSALYGNAAGGVLSLRTTDAVGRLEGTARLTGGSFAFRKWQLSAGAPLGDGGVRLTAAQTLSDGFRDHSKKERRHLAVRVMEPIGSRTTVRVLGVVTDDPLAQNPGALTRAEMDTLPSQADARNVGVNARKSVTQFQGGLAVEHVLSPRASVEAAGFVVRRSLDNPLSFATIDLDRWAWGGRAAATVTAPRLPGAPMLTAGVDAQWQHDDRVNTRPDGSAVTLDQFERVMEFGPFVQATATIGPRVTLTAGLRYDRIDFEVDDRLASDGDQSGSRVMDALSGTIGLAAAATEAFQPYVSLGTSFETPTTTELVNRPQGGGGINQTLDPQQATNVEAGVRGTVHVLDYQIAAFHADVRGELIPFEVPTEPGRRFFQNAGTSRHRGVEVGGTIRGPYGTSVVGAYTLAKYVFTEFRTASDTLDGKTIPGVPVHRLHLSARFDGSLGVWVAADLDYSSSVVTDDRNTAAADAWTTLSVRAGWDGAFGRARVRPFVSVLNLLDERYASSVVVNAFGGRYYEPAPGRSVIVGLEVGAR